MLTTSGIKFSFFNQTGNFQFETNLNLDSLLSYANIGISGVSQSGLNGATTLNFSYVSGKILDSSGRFVASYKNGDNTKIAGNVINNKYDIFINDIPISFGNYRATGTYNYFYINPTNISIDYSLSINGTKPSISLIDINCFSGDREGTGYLVNNNLPVIIYSGGFSNFANMPFTISGIHTGTLFQTGNYYVLPTDGASVGNYTGNLQLLTNGGLLEYTTVINITGTPIVESYSFNLNGDNTIYDGMTNLYMSNVQSVISPVPMLASLEYLNGSGTFYTGIDVLTGWAGNITGAVTGSGLIIQCKSEIGTGIGGQLNNTGSGLATGYITGIFTYATGNFTWPLPVIVTGYGTGFNYSGIGTGTYNAQITGTILTGSGLYYLNNTFTGDSTSIYSIGHTGFIRGTGQIFYNTPSNFDKLYIYNTNFAIVNNFHYTSLSTLTSYLNSNTGTHYVTAIDDTVNTVTLSGLYSPSLNSTNINISLDDTNLGDMSLSGPNLSGGQLIGVGRDLITTGQITGFINHTFTGSGNYVCTGAGYLFGTGVIIDHIKTFTGTWNLLTGDVFAPLDYRHNSYYNAEKDKYSNNYPEYFMNSTMITQLQYINSVDTLIDTVKLTISGLNTNSGISILVTGNFIN
jgi:hypothetical protein